MLRSQAMLTEAHERLRRLAASVARLGYSAADTDELKAQKATLTIAAVTVTILAIAWVGTYFALGLVLPASIPLAYQVVSLLALAAFFRTKAFRFFRLGQLGLMLVLPFALQWSLGGYEASSAVSLWALIAAFGALFFYRADAAIPWFVAFMGLTTVSAFIDPVLAAHPAAILSEVRVIFFALNVGGVAITAYLLMQYFVRARERALSESETLLLNVLPRAIAERLKREPGVIAEHHDNVTVLFADVVGFTPFVERTPATQVVAVLNEVFTAFDGLADRHGLEKIKTIGDAYMVVAGLPEARVGHVTAASDMALEMVDALSDLRGRLGLTLEVRIGIDTGPVVAGVIGSRKFIYDVWGDTVNTASRMESHGVPGRVQVTGRVRDALGAAYAVEDRGLIELKGKGPVQAFLLRGHSTRA